MNLFFCGGIAKSGTTLLQRILNLHNDIICQFEDDLNYLLQEFIRIHKGYNLRIKQTGDRTGFAWPIDRSEAVKWYRKAAKQGHIKAQYYLGELLANGQGVDEDYVRSYAWMFLAKSANDEQAEKNIKILEREMSKEQLAEAKILVTELQKQISNQW